MSCIFNMLQRKLHIARTYRSMEAIIHFNSLLIGVLFNQSDGQMEATKDGRRRTSTYSS